MFGAAVTVTVTVNVTVAVNVMVMAGHVAGKDDVIGMCELDVGRVALKHTGFGRRGVAVQLRETANPHSALCGSLVVDVTVIADTALVHHCAKRMQAVFRMRMARKRYLEVCACTISRCSGVVCYFTL